MSNTLGIDIAVWQDNNSTAQFFDPTKALAMGVSFVLIKVSQANWIDPDFVQNWAVSKKHLYVGGYHFMTWDVPARKQAETFWGAVKNVISGTLPLFVDFEWWTKMAAPANALNMLYDLLERLKQLAGGHPLGIYTSKSFWDEMRAKAKAAGVTLTKDADDPYWTQYALWLCDINPPVPLPSPWKRWDFRQWTFKLPGLMYGVESQDLDGDYYNGTVDEMIARYNLPDIGLGTEHHVYLPIVGNGEQPVEQPAPIAVTALTKKKYRVKAPANLRVRLAARPDGERIGTLFDGDIVTGIPDGDWVNLDCYAARVWNGQTLLVEVT